MAHNFNVNNTLDAFKVPRNIYNAIQNASRSTGVNFTYLVEKAAAESSFNPDAKARTSSATGLFQFIESTWLGMVKNHGAKYGLQDYAAKIGADGRVASRKDRQEILELRKDPEIASYMAAEFAAENHQQLKNNVGGKIGSTELYMAHFMGAGGASAFLNAMKKNPAMAAADIFPREARANRNVFFDARTGAPRSLQQVHAFFDRKFNGAPAGAVKDSVMTASAAPLRAQGYAGPRTAAASAPAMENRTAGMARNTGAAGRITSGAAGAANNFTGLRRNDPLARISSLMDVLQAQNAQQSLLRITGGKSSDNLSIFPPSLYGNLTLSPAQMMMLSGFTA